MKKNYAIPKMEIIDTCEEEILLAGSHLDNDVDEDPGANGRCGFADDDDVIDTGNSWLYRTDIW